MQMDVIILGAFVADTTYRAARQPSMGETILGESFTLGPGGKGSNQAVAAGMAGASVGMITKLGQDPFADMALATWAKGGVTSLATHHSDAATGAAYIFVDDKSGDNAIIICPGVAATLCPEDVDAQADTIATAKVVMTQLEQPLDAAQRFLHLGKSSGAISILNPAPAAELSSEMIGLCDYITPNESEAEGITGIPVTSPADAKFAAEALLQMGAKAAIITLGENGCLFHDGTTPVFVPPLSAGPVVETTGAGDAFNGGLAAALAEGQAPRDAVLFATATAAISVTRAGTAPSMPERAEIDALVAKAPKTFG